MGTSNNSGRSRLKFKMGAIKAEIAREPAIVRGALWQWLLLAKT